MPRPFFLEFALSLLSAAVLVSCGDSSSSVPEWSTLPELTDVSHPWGRYLEGRRIGLDPGHGRNSNPNQTYEGEVNLAVARLLAEYLERDGAIVILTRDDETDVPLSRRPRLVEEQGGEIFISLHHNALPQGDANYTSTWYHGAPDEDGASLDLARALQRRVTEALRTPLEVPTPILSDHLIYPQAGFRVLRLSRLPAVLCEASFYTNAAERERLADPEYRRREAYGYYLGLVDYFAGGTPTARFVGKQKRGGRTQLEWELDDGLLARGGWGSKPSRILASTISCRVDGERVPFAYDAKTARLTIRWSGAIPDAQLELRFQNLYKHSNFPTRYPLAPFRDARPETGERNR